MKTLPLTLPDFQARAAHEGRLRQHREVLRPQPPEEWHLVTSAFDGGEPLVFSDSRDWQEITSREEIAVPYAPGDKLFVQEEWADVNTEAGPALAYSSTRDVRSWEEWCVEPGPDYGAGPSMNYDLYPAEYAMWWSDLFAGEPDHCWREAKDMPQWASRTTLIIRAVRIERLQEMSEEDAEAEGVKPVGDRGPKYGLPSIDCHLIAYRDHWNATHKPGEQWEDNPWVIVREIEKETE